MAGFEISYEVVLASCAWRNYALENGFAVAYLRGISKRAASCVDVIRGVVKANSDGALSDAESVRHALPNADSRHSDFSLWSVSW